MVPDDLWKEATATCTITGLKWQRSDDDWELTGIVNISNETHSVIWYYRADFEMFELDIESLSPDSDVKFLQFFVPEYCDQYDSWTELKALMPQESMCFQARWRLDTSWSSRSPGKYLIEGFEVFAGSEVQVRIAESGALGRVAFRGDRNGEYVDIEQLASVSGQTFLTRLVSKWQHVDIP